MSSPETPKKRKVWWSVSLRGLMAIVLVIAVVLGWQVRKARIQAKAVASIKRLNGHVGFRHEFDAEGIEIPNAKPWGPIWLHDWIGPDFFRTIHLASIHIQDNIDEKELDFLQELDSIEDFALSGAAITDARMTCLKSMTRLRILRLYDTEIGDETARQIGGLTELEVLYIGDTRMTDSGLSHLRGLKKLRVLDLESLKISDAGLASLGEIQSLQKLNLSRTPITDSGLIHLRQLRNLKRVFFSETDVTEQGIGELRKVLPNTQFFFY